MVAQRSTSETPICIPRPTVERLANAAVLWGGLIGLVGVAVSFHDTLTYGGVDLRNRVVAARALTHGLDPYFWKWHPGAPDTLLDPVDPPASPVSRCTVPPSFLLLFHVPAANLPYATQRVVWFAVQWVLFLATILILSRTALSGLRERLTAATALILLAAHPWWRLHVERGQVYIVYAFLLAIAYAGLRRGQLLGEMLAGGCLGIAIAVRPPIAVVLLPLLLARRWRVCSFALLSSTVVVALTACLYGPAVWVSYAKAMQLWASLPTGPRGLTPLVVEGMTNLASMGYLPGYQSAFYTIISGTGMVARGSRQLEMACLGAGGLLLAWFALRGVRARMSAETALICGSLMAFVLEHFLPASRYSYAYIALVMPLCALLSRYDLRLTLLSPVMSWLLMGLFLTCAPTPMFPHAGIAAAAALFVFAVVLLWRLTSSHPAEVNPNVARSASRELQSEGV